MRASGRLDPFAEPSGDDRYLRAHRPFIQVEISASLASGPHDPFRKMDDERVSLHTYDYNTFDFE